MYKIERRSGYYCVVLGSVVQYRHSMRRAAVEWVAENELKELVDNA